MANVSLTLACQNSCEYCFARDLPSRVPISSSSMERSRFMDVLALLERSGIDQLRLLGGEPTLHPEFSSYVEEALRRGMRILVFSNGQIREPVLRVLESIEPRRLTVLINIASDPTLRLDEVIDRLGERVILGTTLIGKRAEVSHLERAVDLHRAVKAVRLGMALPEVDGTNAFVRPKHYPEIGQSVAAIEERLSRRGVAVRLDCGFVPCMFPEGRIPASRGGEKPVGLCCGPVPDILPDGSLIPCYPLARICRMDSASGSNALGAIEAMGRQLAPYRVVGVYRECGRCDWRTVGACAGGCLAAAMLRCRTGARQ